MRSKERTGPYCRICAGAGESRCPIHSKPILSRVRAEISKESFFGDSPPSIFVGHYGYPKVRAGVLAPPVSSDTDLDSPPKWFEGKLGIPEVVEKRLSLVNMTFPAEISKPRQAAENFSELSMAVTPTEVEARTAKRLSSAVSFDKFASPIGPSAELLEIKLTSNPKIPSKVDSIVSENLPAAESAGELYSYGFDVYYLQRLLSSGLLGKGEETKRLVPTRWSITAADSLISERLIAGIRDFPELERTLVFQSSHLDNEFHVILTPGPWSFEQIEGYVPTTTLMVDTEFHEGRRDYAKNVVGGYYAGRLAVCEWLVSKKKRATALILRSIGEGYFAPLGVWQVRENVRAAMASPPKEFPDFAMALKHCLLNGRLGSEAVLRESKLIKFLMNQRRLVSFL